MKAIAVAVTLGLAAGGAEAAVYTYEYQGNPFSCVGLPDDCTGQPPSPFTGTLVIDESLIWGGTLRGASLSLSMGVNGSNLPQLTTEVRSSQVIAATGVLSPFAYADFMQLSGTPDDFLVNDRDAGFYSWRFDANGEVVSWSGGGAGGASNESGDTFGSYFAMTGTWALVSVVGEVSDVPLPASGAALGLALLGLGLRRRYSSSAPNTGTGSPA